MGTSGGGAGGGGAGGGGAGGGGAGGGGAGGGGAGGGGAGGGGAGGGGAGQVHAGGTSSVLLNTALAVTHDAIVGFWQGDPDPQAHVNSMPKGHDKLDYLTSTRRIDMLTAELCNRFKVTGLIRRPDPSDASTELPGEASLTIDGINIVNLVTPEIEAFENQLIWLRNYADLRFDRIGEINLQLGDILSFMGIAQRLDAAGRRYTLELLTAVQSLCYSLELQIKHYCWAPRPMDFSPLVQPIIQTPDHSSFPSGHATEAFALATVLNGLSHKGTSLQDQIANADVPFRIAHRVAVNRTVAGVHFPIDSAAGATLGCMIGDAVLATLDPRKPLQAAFSEGGQFDRQSDFLLSTLNTSGWAAGNSKVEDPGIVLTSYAQAVKEEWVSS